MFYYCGSGKNGKIRVYDTSDGICEEVYPEVVKASGVPIKWDFKYNYSMELYNKFKGCSNVDVLEEDLMNLHSKFGYGLESGVDYDFKAMSWGSGLGLLGLFLIKCNVATVTVNIVHIMPSNICRSKLIIPKSYDVIDFSEDNIYLFIYDFNQNTNVIFVAFQDVFGANSGERYEYRFDRLGRRIR